MSLQNVFVFLKLTHAEATFDFQVALEEDRREDLSVRRMSTGPV
jgi:hypothetical protein